MKNSEFSFRTRQSDWDRLKQDPKRLLNAVIIGGGIVGAGLLRELTLHSISNVYLFEKNDFGSGTSGASSKLIHAGLRYLEQAWIRLKKFEVVGAWKGFLYVWAASLERKRLGKVAPFLIKPKKIFFVVGRSDQRSGLSIAAGVWVYYLMQLLQGQWFGPPQTFLGNKMISAVLPGIDADAVKAVFTFWDSETDDTRLVIENLQDAHRRGGSALNYVEVLSAKKEGSDFVLSLQNSESGEKAEVRSKLIINAAGPWLDEVKSHISTGASQPRLIDRVAGGHLDVYPHLTDQSCYITASDGRLVFILKREEDGLVYSRIGTTERELSESDSSDNIKISKEEENYLKDLVKIYFRDARLDETTIVRRDEGIRPLVKQSSIHSFQKSREHSITNDQGIVHVAGVKLTDFRKVSEEVFHSIDWKALNISVEPGNSSKKPLRDGNPDQLYLEGSHEEIFLQTMVIHWDDYVRRRRGLKPILDLKTNAKNLAPALDVLANLMRWDSVRKSTEWDRALKS